MVGSPVFVVAERELVHGKFPFPSDWWILRGWNCNEGARKSKTLRCEIERESEGVADMLS